MDIKRNLQILPLLLGIICVHSTTGSIQDAFQQLVVELTKTQIYDDIVPDSTNATYDFIIVGSGSGGSVLANRLSENPQWRILLLEAGDETSYLTDIPYTMPSFQFTSLDWQYTSEKQENICLGCPNQRMHLAKGKALGGTTEINYSLHVRGNPKDYDRWAALGNPGWSYQDVLPYFIKMEDASIAIADEGYHGKGGYLSVGDMPYRSKAADVFVQAAQEVGHPYVDYNGEDQMGVSYTQGNVRDGIRWTGDRAYIQTAKNRTNLTIIKNARVTKVLIENNTAYGVLFDKEEETYEAIAEKEVILSAGTFASPQLLMLSGVGPKEHLEELGIPVVKDLPVGKTMKDHVTFAGLAFHLNESINLRREDILSPFPILDFYRSGTGPLASICLADALIYMKTNVSEDVDNYPDIELLFTGGNLALDMGLLVRRTLTINDTVYDSFFKPLEGKTYFQMFPMLTRPKSVGHLKLRSNSVYDHPLIYLNYFTDEDNSDMRTLIASVREIQKISASSAFQKYNATMYSVPMLGCENVTFDSDDYWECVIRTITTSFFHQTGTCKMGPESDEGAVVDSKLKVYGIANLRVADTSIIPLSLNAHTNIPAYMVGEKASDIIKEYWQE